MTIMNGFYVFANSGFTSGVLSTGDIFNCENNFLSLETLPILNV